MSKKLPIFILTYIWSVTVSLAQENTFQGALELKRIEGDNNKWLFYRGYEANTTLEINGSNLVAMDINTGAGKVVVKGTNRKDITVEANIMLSAKNIDRAADIVQKFMVLSLEQEGDHVRLNSYFDFHKRTDFAEAVNPNGFFSAPVRKIDVTIKVPKHLSLKINDRSGDLFVEHIENDVSIYDRSGDIRIKDIKGNLMLNDASGDISLEDLNSRGNEPTMISIRDRSGVIDLDQVHGNIKLTDRSGDIAIKRTKGDITLRDSSGHLDIRKVEGDVKLVDASGDIEARDISGNVILDDHSGGIYVSNVTKDIHVRDAGTGDLRIKNYEGKISGDLKRLYK